MNSNHTFTHVVVVDFSPTEQLMSAPERVITLGGVTGAVDLVGADAQHPVRPMRLRKWSRRNDRYALRLVGHLQDLVAGGLINCLKYHAEEHAIKQIGDAYLDRMKDVLGNLRDQFRLDVNQNRKGRNRTVVGLTDDETGQTDNKNMLVDDLRILAWICYLLEKLDVVFQDASSDYTGLRVCMDRLPTDGDNLFKLELLAGMIGACCDHRVSLTTHEKSVVHQYDIIADNVAGLANEIYHHPSSDIAKAVQKCSPSIFGIVGEMVTPSLRPT